LKQQIQGIFTNRAKDKEVVGRGIVLLIMLMVDFVGCLIVGRWLIGGASKSAVFSERGCVGFLWKSKSTSTIN